MNQRQMFLCAYKQRYIIGNSWCVIVKPQFSIIISPTSVSYVYGWIKRILYLIFISSHFNVTVPLVQHWVISNGPLYGFHIWNQNYYLAWLYLQLYCRGLLFYYFCWCYLYYFASDFSDVFIINPLNVFLG